MPNGSDDNFITSLQNELKDKFNIGHTTFQIENKNLQQNCETDC
jgi:cobalt-zinc-cadmium efflux system protein